jgi:methylphosphotriester-DNA--protein-cysteine methyltransferase
LALAAATRWTSSSAVIVTTYYLAHQFKKRVGIPPAAFISRRRAQHAAFPLTGTDDSIASIGRAFGRPIQPRSRASLDAPTA